MIRPPPSSTLFPYPPLFRSPCSALPQAKDLPVAAVAHCAHLCSVTRAMRTSPPILNAAGRCRISPQEAWRATRSEEHTSELQSQSNLVCRLLLEKKKKTQYMSGSGKEEQLSNSKTPDAKLRHLC